MGQLVWLSKTIVCGCINGKLKTQKSVVLFSPVPSRPASVNVQDHLPTKSPDLPYPFLDQPTHACLQTRPSISSSSCSPVETANSSNMNFPPEQSHNDNIPISRSPTISMRNCRQP